MSIYSDSFKESLTHKQQIKGHVQALQADECIRTSQLKANGASCSSCTHCRATQYMLHCTLKKGKNVHHYNICHHHSTV